MCAVLALFSGVHCFVLFRDVSVCVVFVCVCDVICSVSGLCVLLVCLCVFVCCLSVCVCARAFVFIDCGYVVLFRYALCCFALHVCVCVTA